eukprot:CAMPEP_0204620502 /NCGR_PEP_ID=MMETSP0717-20131115/6522_1 /ASSEMBLY_ACC=CAM_ASM_000666 /TAXON_ID=230516 /ORGANISM="Chaetoceros curvisetus" /LENGTH=180 /DNA_ID=CAMNT_0051634721 /DNA_START=606 /DNA_END=1148 /DNA_ORIENTATION=+
MTKSSALILAACAISSVSAFAPNHIRLHSTSSLEMAKGFGEKKVEVKREKSEGQIRREGEASKYDEISKTGGQEYNIYVRQFGSDDQSWFPCGAIAVPRGAQVSDAVFANEPNLKTAIVRTYPKLKGFEEEFEFGYNLKIYPDDPVEVAMKGMIKKDGMSVGNWISNLLSPIDASEVGRN